MTPAYAAAKTSQMTWLALELSKVLPTILAACISGLDLLDPGFELGLVAVEAQACGLPVRSQPVPGLTEVRSG